MKHQLAAIIQQAYSNRAVHFYLPNEGQLQNIIQLVVELTDEAGMASFTYNDYVHRFGAIGAMQLRQLCIQLCSLHCEVDTKQVRIFKGVRVEQFSLHLYWHTSFIETVLTEQRKVHD